MAAVLVRAALGRQQRAVQRLDAGAGGLDARPPSRSPSCPAARSATRPTLSGRKGCSAMAGGAAQHRLGHLQHGGGGGEGDDLDGRQHLLRRPRRRGRAGWRRSGSRPARSCGRPSRRPPGAARRSRRGGSRGPWRPGCGRGGGAAAASAMRSAASFSGTSPGSRRAAMTSVTATGAQGGDGLGVEHRALLDDATGQAEGVGEDRAAASSSGVGPKITGACPGAPRPPGR